jgi:hypothetical protein
MDHESALIIAVAVFIPSTGGGGGIIFWILGTLLLHIWRFLRPLEEMLLLLDLIDWRFDEPEEQLELAFEWNGEFPPLLPVLLAKNGEK